MSKIELALRSRTFWTAVVMLVLNLIPHAPVSQDLKDLINGALTLLITYFHLNPSQNYTTQTPTIDGTPAGGSFRN